MLRCAYKEAVVFLHSSNRRLKVSHQIEHAAQHGQQQEGRLGAHAVNGAHHRPTGGRNPKDEGPDGIQIKLKSTNTQSGVINIHTDAFIKTAPCAPSHLYNWAENSIVVCTLAV